MPQFPRPTQAEPSITLDDLFPVLENIESVSLAECKAAYDRCDEVFRGAEMDHVQKYAPCARSTRHFLEIIFPGNFANTPRNHCDDLAMMVEYVRRQHPNSRTN